MRRIRVFHLIKSLGRGGAEQLLVETLRRADRSRFELGYGYFLPWKDALVSDLERLGAEVRCFDARGPGGMLASVPRVASHLRRWRADVVHCHLPLAGVVGRLAAAAARVPVVYTEHNLQERYHPLTRWSNRLTWRLQRRGIAVSGEVARSARAHMSAKVPVQVVLNGIPVERFQPDSEGRAAVRRELGFPADAPVVGTVAVFRTQKRLDLWLRAARQVYTGRPSTRFLLVGDGPERETTEALAHELGLRDVVRFAGLQTDVLPYLSAMDLFLMSSDFEGLPLALLEAMASGLPVVATRVGGVPEVISDGVHGLLASPGDEQALASAVEQLLADPERRTCLTSAARALVEERFGTSRMVGELESIYSALGSAHA
ncbi:MAG: glycosyltransferase [Planctomycetota bacterium]|nr:glycosyltransferase [Planctomycetota bacterium]